MVLLRTRNWLSIFTASLALSSCCFFDFCLQRSNGCESFYSSARLILPAENTCSQGLEIEFMATCEGIKMYLNAFGLQIPADDCCESYCESPEFEYSTVCLTIDGTTYPFSAKRFAGGQRLLVPPDVQDSIVVALHEGLCVSLSVGRYQSTISPDRFLRLYEKMAL